MGGESRAEGCSVRVESAGEWGVRQAELAPRWSLAQLRAVAASVGVRLRTRPLPAHGKDHGKDTETAASDRGRVGGPGERGDV